ncbi:hypothetical protein PULV_a2323 [Pseudoalteromonas ulvae UL12]|uniref:hypothetical protein n=1 Tax=Pseudoalteromonas ulvae TaxID=107327 RepID=UPI001592B777|nr:hypothetical protein [Pseudoalteromonas ulvae]MBE0364597.1 hypothetical protein [Pseudoalteromonas ulvae UL12]
MLHQLIISVLLPLVTSMTPVSNEPVVVEDSQVQDVCYLSPGLCEWRAKSEANNG